MSFLTPYSFKVFFKQMKCPSSFCFSKCLFVCTINGHNAKRYARNYANGNHKVSAGNNCETLNNCNIGILSSISNNVKNDRREELNVVALSLGSYLPNKIDSIDCIEKSIALLKKHGGEIIAISCLYGSTPSYDNLTFYTKKQQCFIDEKISLSSLFSTPHSSFTLSPPLPHYPTSFADNSKLYNRKDTGSVSNTDSCVYYNAVVIMRTSLSSAYQVLSILHDIEKQLKRPPPSSSDRIQNLQNMHRTIDIDLLFFNNEIIVTTIDQSRTNGQTEKIKKIEEMANEDRKENVNAVSSTLIVPHPEIATRNFILYPLNDVFSEYIHPFFKKTIKELLDENIRFGKSIDNENLHCDARWNMPIPSYVLGRHVWNSKSKNPHIMAICNLTPDSFSDGGKYKDEEQAIQAILRMIDEGAEIIDIGGASSSQGRLLCTEKEEINRMVKVIEKVRQENKNILISVDTQRSSVLKAAISAGADLLNDISGCEYDSEMLNFLQKKNISAIFMHSNNSDENENICKEIEDVISYIKSRLEDSICKGLPPWRFISDVGLGFGKTMHLNYELLNKMDYIKHKIGMYIPQLIGHSRKRFIGSIVGSNLSFPSIGKTLERDCHEELRRRIFGGMAVICWCALKNVDIIRTHDVLETKCARDTMLEIMNG